MTRSLIIAIALDPDVDVPAPEGIRRCPYCGGPKEWDDLQERWVHRTNGYITCTEEIEEIAS